MHLEFALGKEGGRERDGQAANVLIGVNQPLVRGHPEAATGNDEILWVIWKIFKKSVA